MSSNARTYETITTRLIELIEQTGHLPWERPWDTSGADAPVSVHGHVYRGVNRLILGLVAQVVGYEDNRWITYRQARKLGGYVRKGERGTTVILWKPITKKGTADPETGEETRDGFLLARTYTVFNVEQTSEVVLPPPPERPRHEWDPAERAEEVVEAMPMRPEIRHTGIAAYYDPSSDRVTMPDRDRFAVADGYYGALFHELAHATGHASRLDRFKRDGFAGGGYSQEELTAELAAAFILGAVGLDTPERDQEHAAYLAGWLRVLRAEPRMIVTAAARASKAADWILGEVPAERAQAAPEMVAA